MRISERKTYDCKPTMTDTEVLEFCKNGYLMLEGVVPDDVNRRTMEYCDQHAYMEPSGILIGRLVRRECDSASGSRRCRPLSLGS